MPKERKGTHLPALTSRDDLTANMQPALVHPKAPAYKSRAAVQQTGRFRWQSNIAPMMYNPSQGGLGKLKHVLAHANRNLGYSWFSHICHVQMISQVPRVCDHSLARPQSWTGSGRSLDRVLACPLCAQLEASAPTHPKPLSKFGNCTPVAFLVGCLQCCMSGLAMLRSNASRSLRNPRPTR